MAAILKNGRRHVMPSFLKFPPSRILKPYLYITQINSQTSIPPKCLRAYRAGPGLVMKNCKLSCANTIYIYVNEQMYISTVDTNINSYQTFDVKNCYSFYVNKFIFYSLE